MIYLTEPQKLKLDLLLQKIEAEIDDFDFTEGIDTFTSLENLGDFVGKIKLVLSDAESKQTLTVGQKLEVI